MKSTKQICTVVAATLVGALVAQGALASCKAPLNPAALPDGRTADKAEMLAAKRQVEAYVRKVSDYIKCEENPVKVNVAKARQVKLADQFNAELREFREANNPLRKTIYR